MAQRQVEGTIATTDIQRTTSIVAPLEGIDGGQQLVRRLRHLAWPLTAKVLPI
jgi:hypothetical protein